MKSKKLAILLSMVMVLSVGCQKKTADGSEEKAKTNTEEKQSEKKQATDVQVFAAASLNSSIEEIIKEYNKQEPDVKITVNADSSGKLLTQVQEGFKCDLFFSAADKQIEELEKGKLLIDGTKKNVLNNKLILITRKDSKTEVTGLKDISKAKSIAIAGDSVPAGAYTRKAMENLGMIKKADEGKVVSTADISEAIGNKNISEQGNVSEVLNAVLEGSSEVGTVYLSDIYGHEDEVKVIEEIDIKDTGKINYPMALVKNEEADENEVKGAKSFYDFLTSETANKIFAKQGFDVEKSK
ncbi:MAG: molybdate ABC transporter substrate-binding protein [Clostridioides sp.]|jgi:molybdate transport system substrate-binding protein|nr:molybdate ABC transporter substrate-binding protein [Clostridioides sp.]